jgi:phosphatidylinositol alpha 1,6-mannosyltransferase
MRIAFFTETFLPKIDGIVNTLCHLLTYLAQHGHESLLFAPEGNLSRYANTRILSYPGVSFPLYPELKMVSPFTNVEAPLRRFRPDLIHVLNPVAMGVAGLNEARRQHLPVVASYHTDVPGFARRWGLGALYDPLVAFFRWIHNQADLNLCPSEATRAELDAQGYQRLRVWSRGVDVDLFAPSRRSQTCREGLSNGESHKPLLLYVGRLSAEKRVDWLLPVLQALPGARLAIVGDGPAREHLEEIFAGLPVIFTGYLRGEALAEAYASADLFVFPGANETLGNVVLEAMASGLPVVAPRSGGIQDIVQNGQSGFLVNAESVEAMVAAVDALVANPAFALEMGRTGREIACQRRWDLVFDRLLDEYAALIRIRKGSTLSTFQFQ